MAESLYQNDYTPGLRGVLPGWPDASDRGSIDDSLSLTGDTAQVETYEVTSTTTTLTMVRGGVTRTFSTSGLGSNALAAAAMLAQVQADVYAHAWVTSSLNTATITLTAREPGTVGAVAYTATGATLVEATAAAAGSTHLFGLGVQYASTVGKGEAPSASTTSAVAQVWHLTPTPANTSIYYASVRLNDGREYSAKYSGDGSDTAQEVVEGLEPILNAQLPATSVVVTEDNAKLIATSEVAGTPFTVGAGSDKATATWLITESVANVVAATTTARPVAGVALYSQTAYAQPSIRRGESAGVTGYSAYDNMRVRRKGRGYLYVDGTVSRFDPVYMRLTATGSEKVGAFRADTDSGDAILMSGMRFLEAGVGTAAAPAAVLAEWDMVSLGN